jgi:hypothetical protein
LLCRPQPEFATDYLAVCFDQHGNLKSVRFNQTNHPNHGFIVLPLLRASEQFRDWPIDYRQSLH